MKQHIKRVAAILELDPILAIESLFQWAPEYNVENSGSAYRVVRSEDNPEQREMYLSDAMDPVIVTSLKGDGLTMQINAVEELPDELLNTLNAMGVSGTEGSGKGFVCKVQDAETLDSRRGQVDALWILLRRLRRYQADPQKLHASAHALLQFALKWNGNCEDVSNNAETPRQVRATLELETQAKAFQDWEVAGLQGVNLHYDPRGSAMALMFEDFAHPMELNALSLDWPIGNVKATTETTREPTRGRFDVRPTKVPEDVRGVLSGLVIGPDSVKIVQKLPKRLYAKVNDALEALGGQWSSSRQAHVFDEAPEALVDALIETGEVFTSRDYEFFATQPSQVKDVIDCAQIEPGMEVCEPSAGGASLAMAAAEIVGKDKVTCFELMPRNVATLKSLGFKIDGPQDFLQVVPDQRFDRIIMNPPFSGGRDVAHIQHAMKFLRPGGVLVAIASTQWQTHDTAPAKEFQAYVRALNGTVRQIERGAFKAVGTDVPTTLLVLKSPGEPQAQEKVKPVVTAALQPHDFW